MDSRSAPFGCLIAGKVRVGEKVEFEQLRVISDVSNHPIVQGRPYVTDESMKPLVALGIPGGDATRQTAHGPEQIEAGHAGCVEDLH